MAQSATTNVVLVHGNFVDGSGWEGVYSFLKKADYKVAIVQNPTTHADQINADLLAFIKGEQAATA